MAKKFNGRFEILIDTEQRAELDRVSAALNMTASGVTRLAIADYLHRMTAGKPSQDAVTARAVLEVWRRHHAKAI